MIVREDWTAGNFNQWLDPHWSGGVDGLPVTNANFHIKTIRGKSAWTCSYGSPNGWQGTISRKVGANAGIPALAIRQRYCLFATDLTWGSLVLATADAFISYQSSVSSNFLIWLMVLSNGAIWLRVHDDTLPPPTDPVSAPGIIPMDGTEFAIQFKITFADNRNVLYEVVVNNVPVMSGSVLAGTSKVCLQPDKYPWGWYDSGHQGDCVFFHEEAGINHVNISVGRYPSGCGSVPVMHLSNTYTELDDSPTIIDFMPTAGYKIVGTDCWAPTVITDMLYDCTLGVLTILGSNFIAGCQYQLRGPEDNGYTFTQTSLTSTRITGTIANFIAGQYCMTITNPCT
jgi:hypothetical protein